MVNDMLWLAKSDHGLLKPVQVPLNLASEVNELFGFFEALAEEQQIRLALEGQAPIVQGDRAMLRRAISNLLSNAIRHTSSGGKVLVQLQRGNRSERRQAAAVLATTTDERTVARCSSGANHTRMLPWAGKQ